MIIKTITTIYQQLQEGQKSKMSFKKEFKKEY